MTREVELLWFAGCANHRAARAPRERVIADVAPAMPIREVDASDPAVAEHLRFPGSPTIRMDGRDIDPTYADPGDFTLRCRLYRSAAGLSGLPDRAWIEDALADEGSKGTRAVIVSTVERQSPAGRGRSRAGAGGQD